MTITSQAPHLPVLPDEVLALAQVRPGELWVDGTVGYGGHASRLLAAGARLIGVDQDPEALAFSERVLAPFGDQVTLCRGNFRDAGRLLEAQGVAAVDGVLVDLGVSSLQLDEARRGFSFSTPGPIDMRMDPDGPTTALDLILRSTDGELATILWEFGEVPRATTIVKALKRYAVSEGPHDTMGLAQAIEQAVGRQGRRHHPATQVFQALRIAVNDELGALAALLASAGALLKPGGRLLVISFHSLEDRLVKRTFADWTTPPPAPRRGLPPPDVGPMPFELLARGAVMAGEAELEENSRARSARLRGVRRRGGDR